MQTRNNYEKAVFNGDIGRIEDIEPEVGDGVGEISPAGRTASRSVRHQRTRMSLLWRTASPCTRAKEANTRRLSYR